MSLENTAPASELAPAAPDKKDDERPVFSGDADGLAAAAKEYAQRAAETDEIRADDPDKALTAKQAADQLSEHHKRTAEERDAIRKAMQLDDGPELDPLEVRVTELEKGRTPQQSEIDQLQARNDAEAERIRAQGAAQLEHVSRQAQQLDGYRQQLIQQFNSEYPEIQSIEDIQTLASYDPERATQAVHHLQQAEAALETQRQALVGQATLAQQAVGVWAEHQDRIFAEQHPEITEAARPALAKAGIKVLKDSGLSDEEIAHHWSAGALRSAAAQNILLKAAKYELAQQQFKRASPKPPPPVARPGRGSADQHRAHVAGAVPISTGHTVRSQPASD